MDGWPPGPDPQHQVPITPTCSGRTDHCQSRALDLYCQELMDPAYVPAFREVTKLR
ncbi:MAG: hypothetical protein ACLT9P_03245 [Evtepia gabavorous]